MFLSRGVVLSLLPLLLTSTSLAVTIERQLDVVNRVLSPDGFDRITTLAGGSFPGPLIVGKKGDQFSVTVNNKLQNDSLDLVTSIHFHGIDQDRTNYADGTTGVTQCPIIPGESFTYQFNVHSQAGTFWYHSHFAGQYCDGLRGVFVIYDDQDPLHTLYDVDNESTIITLSDWFHYLSTNPPYVPEPSATLINGKGRAIGGPATPLAVVNVLSGLRYRFRVIAMSCDSNFMFSIDAHSLTVIEADAHTTQPHTVDQIQILSGQRYSVIVHANQQVDNYWIRAIRSENNPNITQSIDGGQNAAILRYVGASLTEPSITSTSNLILLKEADLHPFPAAPPPKADEVINLNVTLDMVKGRYLMNGVSFEPPSVPVLLQILSGTRKATDLLPAGAVYGLERNKTYDVVVPAGVLGGPHPLHIHGHSFWVIQSASSVKNEINPVLRDVVNMGDAGDTVTIRFTADNPGPWFFHCHINTHLEAGFAVVFAEDIPSISQASVPSSSWNELCPHYQQYAQGTGNSSASNRSGR